MMTQPIPLGHGGTWKDVQYHSYVCSQCGKEANNTYSEPYRTDMLRLLLCWTCNFWREFGETKVPEMATIIEGRSYDPGSDRNPGQGMAGRRFDIEYIPPSVYAGQKITTNDLWSGSEIPAYLREKFPDTARFLGGAEFCRIGDGGAWNSSDRKVPEYPRPSALRRQPLIKDVRGKE